MVRKGLLVLLAALLVPALAAAYTMVLKDGRKIEAQSRYMIESGIVKFTGADGAASAGAEGGEAAPAEGEAGEASKPEPPKEDTVEYWQERLAPLRAELAQVEQQLTQLRSG